MKITIPLDQSERATDRSSINMLTRSKFAFLLLSVCILAACSGQGNSSTGSSELSTQSKSQTLKTENTSLLASLAKEYPNGQLPADRAAEAAKALSQNPSVFKTSAALASQPKASAQNLQSQAFTAADFKPVYRIQNTTLPGSYFFTIYDSEKTAALAANPNWRLEGTAFYTLPAASSDLSPVYRFRNKQNGSYLYTAYESEKTDIQTNYSATYELEGVAWRAQQTPAQGFTALFRFRNKTNGTYLNTSYESERDAILKDYSAIFELEGIAYYVQNSLLVAPIACAAALRGNTGYSLVFKGCDLNNVAEYYDKTECVRDNATGLIWEGKPATGSRSSLPIEYINNYLNNLDDTDKKQIRAAVPDTRLPPGVIGIKIVFLNPTADQIVSPSNTIGYQNSVNVVSLCGFSDWRRPSPNELLGLVKTTEMPKIDNTWFPNTYGGLYWTDTAYVNYVTEDSTSVGIDFNTGLTSWGTRGFMGHTLTSEHTAIRLVR